ncbi:MAG: class I SAM-dependent methyltransferase, partial [Geminicoccaceae bacterium]
IPDDDHLILGDLKVTLPSVLPRFSKTVALVHSDIGTGDVQRNQRLAAWIATTIPEFLTRGAWIAADQALNAPNLVPKALPKGISSDRYFVYQHTPT